VSKFAEGQQLIKLRKAFQRLFVFMGHLMQRGECFSLLRCGLYEKVWCLRILNIALMVLVVALGWVCKIIAMSFIKLKLIAVFKTYNSFPAIIYEYKGFPHMLLN